MKAAICVAFLALILVPLAQAQAKALSPEGQRLTEALARLQMHPDDLAAQRAYLQAFPHDYAAFLRLFDLGQELYDGHEFILVLHTLAEHQEKGAGQLLLGLCKDARWDADAPNYLQHEAVAYGAVHTQMFATLLRRLTKTQRTNAIVFLAHAENFEGYPEFQEIIERLKGLGQNALAQEFEQAKALREKRQSRIGWVIRTEDYHS